MSRDQIPFHHAWVRAAEAYDAIREARKTHRTSYNRIIARFAELYIRRSFSIREIVSRGLLDPDITSEWLLWNLSKQSQYKLQAKLNPRAFWNLTEDKSVFYRFSLGAGLPVPRFFGCIAVVGTDSSMTSKQRARESAVRALECAGADELVIKPSAGVYGRGVLAVSRRAGRFVDSDGEDRSAGEVYDWVAGSREFDSFVVQERLQSHPELARLSGTSNLQTVRMVTYVRESGESVIGCCQLKILGGDSLTDNYGDGRRGNLIGDIPDAAGHLAGVYRAAATGSGVVAVDRHPRTGVPFRGFRLPFWTEACRLVERAAEVFLPLRTIGWDVAITAEGPLLIEGNVTWDPAYEGEVGGEILRAIVADDKADACDGGLRPSRVAMTRPRI